MGFESLLAAAAEGDDQELRKCIEGLDVDRNGLFNRHDPVPPVVVGRPKGIHGRFNRPTPVITTGSMGESALHKAAAEGRYDVCAYLLSAAEGSSAQIGTGGARALLKQRNNAGQTALVLACLHGSLETVRLLIEAGSDLEDGDDINGYTPLHSAVRQGHVFVVQALLDARADPNSTDGMGGTPLHIAARYDVAEAVDLLAGSGCSLDCQRSSDHFTALHLACKYNQTPNTVQALLAARADPGLVSRAGYPPAYLAASQGVASVVEFMCEKHWEQLLHNTDKEGMTRLREGGQLTVRASLDKALQRLCRAMTDPDHRGLWWDPAAVVEQEGLYEGMAVHVQGGLPSGRWVSKGPVVPEELERILQGEVKSACDMLKSKVGLFTSDDKISQLVKEELSAPLDIIRTVNQLWAEGRVAAEGFRFAEALSKFASASKRLRADWWGTRAVEKAEAVTEDMARLRKLKEDADKKMVSASRLRTSFQFADAAVWYRQAGPVYAQVGHLAKFAEAHYRLQEMETKAALKAEADDKMERSGVVACEYVPMPLEQEQQQQGGVPFPTTRLQLAEAVALLERCVEIYGDYGDEDMRGRAERRMEATKWTMERQTKAQRMVLAARKLAGEYMRDGAMSYQPTDLYHFGAAPHKLRIADAVPDYEMAANLFGDANDSVNQGICAVLAADARDRGAQVQTARAALEAGQAAETAYQYDVKLKTIIVFGGAPLRDNEPPRQPYVRHAVPEDYPLKDETAGVQFHRLKLDEAYSAYGKARRMLEMAGDLHNMAEAQRREDSADVRRKLLHEGHELIKEGQACIRSRQYAAGHEKYMHAADVLTQAHDVVNAAYVGHLVADALAKRKLGEEAARMMSAGKELVACKESFDKWQDVLSQGLRAFTEADKLFGRAVELYGTLDDAPSVRSATEAKKDAEERKVHAEEIKVCRCLTVQPGGDWAPQRKDKNRRTMPYSTAQQAILDAATEGRTSTYHQTCEVRAGSTVVLRMGQHEVADTIIIRHAVTIAAEDGITSADCVLFVAGTSLMQVRSPSVKVDNISLRQTLGEGDEDYWSGGLYTVKVVSGMVEMTGCMVQSDRGSGVVVTGSGKAVLTRCSILDCGHYGIGADGRDALVDLRECVVDGSKFEEVDQRNGARIVGFTHE